MAVSQSTKRWISVGFGVLASLALLGMNVLGGFAVGGITGSQILGVAGLVVSYWLYKKEV